MDLSIGQILSSPEFRIPDASPAPDGGASGGAGFGGALASAVGKLASSQSEASAAAQGVADGSAGDLSNVVMSVERASLELQLATQFRNKAVDAYQELFRMQV